MEVEDGSLTTGSCLYFPQKKRGILFFFLFYFLILSCLVFLFFLLCKFGGGMEAQIRKSSGASFDLVSKERGSAFSWKEGGKD